MLKWKLKRVGEVWTLIRMLLPVLAAPSVKHNVNSAKTFFNDTYQLFDKNGSQIEINETGISWPGDKGYKYKEGPNSGHVQWINPEDEHFIVWMRTSGLPNFRKLWGRI